MQSNKHKICKCISTTTVRNRSHNTTIKIHGFSFTLSQTLSYFIQCIKCPQGNCGWKESLPIKMNSHRPLVKKYENHIFPKATTPFPASYKQLGKTYKIPSRGCVRRIIHTSWTLKSETQQRFYCTWSFLFPLISCIPEVTFSCLFPLSCWTKFLIILF